MNKVIREEEIDSIVKNIIADYDGGKTIDAINIFNKPDKSEVRNLVNDLFEYFGAIAPVPLVR